MFLALQAYYFYLWVDQTGEVQRGQVTTVWRMLQHLKVQLPEGFHSMDGSVWVGIVMQQRLTVALDVSIK